MGKMQKSIIDKKIILFIFLIFFSFSFAYSLENCPSSLVTLDKIPCFILLPFNQTNLNCANYNVQIWNNSHIIYTQILFNYSPNFMCNAIFNQTSLGTYTLKWSTGDTGKITIEVGYMNLLIGIVFLSLMIIFTIMTHKMRDVQGSSFIYSGLVFVFSLIFAAMLFRGFQFIQGVILPFDINFYLSMIMFLYSIVFLIITYNLVMDYKSRNPIRELDPREY